MLGAKERGQARLPDPELIRVELVIVAGKAFNVNTIAQVRKSRGQEGGLAPTLGQCGTFPQLIRLIEILI